MGRLFSGVVYVYIQALKPPDRPTPITKIFCVTFVPNLGQKWHQLAIMIPEKKSELKKTELCKQFMFSYLLYFFNRLWIRKTLIGADSKFV